ncbi:hypothetical protein EC988_009610, partial [Linderina pennispora]
MGVLKFILRTLTTMGYQARFYVLQAGNYGLAQSRRRLFVWAAKRGCKLPGIPTPITTFAKSGQTNITLPDGIRFMPFDYLNGNAPHHAVTVKDAIGDLPEFEYINPAILYPDTDTREDTSHIPKYTAVNSMPSDTPGDRDGRRTYVGEMHMRYSRPPCSEFQRLRRREHQVMAPGVDSDCDALVSTLHNHVSRKFNDINIERICNIAFAFGSDHHSLPEKLKPWCLSNKDSAAARHGGWKGL